MAAGYCIQGLDATPAEARGCVLTIGNFDGVHVGHQRILQTARRVADQCGARVVAMTFEPSPGQLLHPDQPPGRLSTVEAKARLLRQAGADWVVLVKTDRDLLALEAEEFLQRIIMDTLAPRHVVEGQDFFFGRGRSGTIDVLRAAGGAHGFDVHVVEPMTLEFDGQRRPVSSTLTRHLLGAGRVEDANRCLGRAFALWGEVIGGEGRGRALQYPTINIDPGEQMLPADGVYAGWAELEGRKFPAAISIGDKPTFGGQQRCVEAFLLNASGDYYDEEVTLRFLHRLRGQERFADGKALQAQIQKDVQRVRELCG